MEVKQEINLEHIEETQKPLKELEPYINDDGNMVAFEEGNYIMILAKDNDNLRKKRINREHFINTSTTETIQ